MLNSLESPVEVYFEADRISTFGTSGEMLITFLGLFAQEESRLKSEAITWAVDNLFAQGKYYAFPVLGYNKEKGRDSPLTINKEEAKTVRLCYALAIMGYSFSDIAKTMNILGLKSRLGNVHWTVSGVRALLSNEKYAGAIRARKTITRSYKTHKSKKNEGEKPQYYHKEHHEAIVPPEAYDVALRIIKNRRGKNGIPYLKAVSEGILKGFVVVSKNVRGYTLNDYVKASHSIYEEDDDPKINILADKASIFDLRTYDIVSTFSFDDRTKPACSIKDGKIIFNVACKKALRAEKAEMLFHPLKAILALRLSVSEVFSERINDICIIKPVHHSHFTSIALESAGLKSGYRYRIYGAKRTRENESIMLFDLRNAEIIPPKKDIYILPDKYTSRYGDDYYENIAACGLYKIDIEGLWQALHESKPIDSLAGQIVELTEFCQKSLAEFELSEEINHE